MSNTATKGFWTPRENPHPTKSLIKSSISKHFNLLCFLWKIFQLNHENLSLKNALFENSEVMFIVDFSNPAPCCQEITFRIRLVSCVAGRQITPFVYNQGNWLSDESCFHSHSSFSSSASDIPNIGADTVRSTVPPRHPHRLPLEESLPTLFRLCNWSLSFGSRTSLYDWNGVGSFYSKRRNIVWIRSTVEECVPTWACSVPSGLAPASAPWIRCSCKGPVHVPVALVH